MKVGGELRKPVPELPLLENKLLPGGITSSFKLAGCSWLGGFGFSIK